jgi:hypothetical protein
MERERYTNYRNRDNRLVNTDDNRPFWALTDEKWYSEKNYDYYDAQKMDLDRGVYTGELTRRQAAVKFDMGYHAKESKKYIPGLREEMGFSRVANYEREPRAFDSSWYGFTPAPQAQKFDDAEMRFANPILPVNFDAKNNNNNKSLFVNKKNYHNGARNQYIPLEGFATPKKQSHGAPYCGAPEKRPITSDDYEVLPRRKLNFEKKMNDFSADRRDYHLQSHRDDFVDDFMAISINADPLMAIDNEYSLPLWNVTDYAQFTGNVRYGGRKGPCKN